MEFTREKAEEIVSKHGLSEKTIRVWKTRGSIPDKYASPDYIPRFTSKAGKIRHERLFDLLSSGTINITVLADLTQISEIKFGDAKRNKTRLSDVDINKCMIEIKRLKIVIAKTFQEYIPQKFEKLINNPLIHYSVVIKDRYLIDRISFYRKHDAEPDMMLWSQVKEKYVIFALTLNI